MKMVNSSQNTKQHLSPLNTSWQNISMSSMSATSDTATFHSAHAHLSNMELRPLSQPTHPNSNSHIRPLSPTKPLTSPKLESIKMERQDSGYSDSRQSLSSSRRTSTASSTPQDRDRNSSPSKSSKRKTTATSTHSSSRPSTKRNSRSSAQIRTSTSDTRRPNIQQRHTTPYAQIPHTQYQFFQFPTLSDPDPSPETLAAPPPPPPATVQYWTSDSTRRLEYAAIDAASKGVRGFFIKLVPDCILPAGSRRTRFHCEDDAGSDAGSVRRYRLALPAEEKGVCGSSARERGGGSGDGDGEERRRGGLLRRWTTGLRK